MKKVSCITLQESDDCSITQTVENNVCDVEKTRKIQC